MTTRMASKPRPTSTRSGGSGRSSIGRSPDAGAGRNPDVVAAERYPNVAAARRSRLSWQLLALALLVLGCVAVALADAGSAKGAAPTAAAALPSATASKAAVSASPSKTARPTRTTRLDDPMWVFTVEATVAGENPFPAVFGHRVPLAKVVSIAPGVRLSIAVDMSDRHNEVAIDWDKSPIGG